VRIRGRQPADCEADAASVGPAAPLADSDGLPDGAPGVADPDGVVVGVADGTAGSELGPKPVK
jgi:hypothetical protein